ncbi:ead/Ea22-like family protein [Enterobacter hormaechei]|uniref:ead/Ea22-like family protein n=1 Tax=Enterobacter hormaechei TaxID=158836 RepID=UPI0039838E8B
MSNIDKQALREAAEMATESDWIVDAHEGWHAVIPVADAVNGNYIIAEFQGPESKRNRDYVAAANPATVLALLDELEAAEKRIAELSRHLQCAHGFIEHTEAFGHAASNGILCCGDAQWNIDESKSALAAAAKGE